MRKIIQTTAAVLALAGTTLTLAAPADARRYYHRGHGGGRTAAVVGAGILGLAAGAAIASRPYGYGRGYAYADRGYAYAPGYYDYGPDYYYAPPPPPPPPAAYGYGYYGGPRYYYDGPRYYRRGW